MVLPSVRAIAPGDAPPATRLRWLRQADALMLARLFEMRQEMQRITLDLELEAQNHDALAPYPDDAGAGGPCGCAAPTQHSGLQ